jgi:hypothetical protein
LEKPGKVVCAKQNPDESEQVYDYFFQFRHPHKKTGCDKKSDRHTISLLQISDFKIIIWLLFIFLKNANSIPLNCC